MTGILEVLTAAMGEQLDELAGWRFTRLTANLAAGGATFQVETTLGWPAAGTVVLGGVTYSYTSLDPTHLYGITWLDGGVPVVGAKTAHQAGEHVLDFSRTFSALDLTRAQFLSDTAEGRYLDALGRKLGVRRPVNLRSDDSFRKALQALAYLPKGTWYGLELALTAFFGAGNFEIWENFPTSRNTVFVRLLNGVPFAAANKRAAYYERHENRPITLPAGTLAVTGPVQSVEGVRLADEAWDQVLVSRPTTYSEVRYSGDAGVPVWTFSGGGSEVAMVTMNADGAAIYNTGGHAATYTHVARVLPESFAALSLHLQPTDLPSSTDGRQFRMSIQDGAHDLAVGLFGNGGTHSMDVGFINASTGALLAGAVTLTGWHTLTVRKTDALVDLLVDGVLVQTAAVTDFSASTSSAIRWGATLTTTAVKVTVKSVAYWARTDTDFWNDRGTAGEVYLVPSDQLNSHAGRFIPGDVGNQVTTKSTVHPRNNGTWQVSSVISVDRVALIGPTRLDAQVELGHPGRITVPWAPQAPFTYPDDVGKQVTLQTGPNAGTWTISAVLDETGTPLAGSAREGSNAVLVTGAPAWVTAAGIPWNLVPAFIADAGITWELSDAGARAGLNLTLRLPPAVTGTAAVVSAVYTQTLSSQLLREGSGVGWWPAYLPQHPWGPYAAFLKDLTVAGVIPELVTGS